MYKSIQLFLMSKIQNLKAIHNKRIQIYVESVLFLMSKIQNLKAIHNDTVLVPVPAAVVSDVKDTKFESNSQQSLIIKHLSDGCF